MSCHHLTLLDAQRTAQALGIDSLVIRRADADCWNVTAVDMDGTEYHRRASTWANGVEWVLGQAMARRHAEHAAKRAAKAGG